MTSTRPVAPLRPLVFRILLLLNERDRHGYGLMKEVNGGDGPGPILGTLGPGTLYRTLKKLRDDGLIAITERRPVERVQTGEPHGSAAGGPGGDVASGVGAKDSLRRRYYRITDIGREVATAEATRMAELVDAARNGRLLADSGKT